jgi:spore maturation protein CgeB
MTRLSEIRERALRSQAAISTWGVYRRRAFLLEYRRRRHEYAKAASDLNIQYDPSAVADQVSSRLACRGYSPAPRALGDVHTFAFIPRVAWHSALYADLALLGPVSEFDYIDYGYRLEEFQRRDITASERRREMNSKALAAIKEAHRKRSLDWVFIYASGLELQVDLIRSITEAIGVPVVNMCLDDKQSWSLDMFDGQRIGQIDLASVFDLSWTSARVACEWYLVEGGRPLFLPEGFDSSVYRPEAIRRDLGVSFVGQSYGFRPATIRRLRRYGLHVSTFGPGWGTSLSPADQVKVFNRSHVNLGMGGIGYAESVSNVKTRDFEIAGTGGGVYLTSFNSDLAEFFHIGKEILCYRGDDELVELAHYYVKHSDEAEGISIAGRARCLAEHRWLNRYQKVLSVIGVLA